MVDTITAIAFTRSTLRDIHNSTLTMKSHLMVVLARPNQWIFFHKSIQSQKKNKSTACANKQEFLAPFSPISYGYGGLHLDDCYSCFKLQSINNVLQRNIICHATVFALVSTENGGIFIHSNKSTDQFSARLCCDSSHSVAVCVEDEKKF